MGDSEYDLPRLCEKAEVSPRTVRYYIQQGLLPGPTSPGPGARYDDRHLNRIRLIRRLQKNDVPLAKIRQIFDEVGDEGIAQELASTHVAPTSSALEYIRSQWARANIAAPSLSEQGPRDAAPAMAGEQSLGVREQWLTPRRMEWHNESWSGGRLSPGDRAVWERIALAPDVELHLRRPTSRETNRKVEKLIEFYRSMDGGNEK